MAIEAEAELSGCQAVQVWKDGGGRWEVEGLGEVQDPHSRHSGLLSCHP